MEDTAIIRLFQERSQQAIAELSQKYGKLCQSLSRRILNNEEDAKECVNDTWLGVWNSIPPQTPNPLVSYVCRITRNLSVKRLRHNMAAKRNSYYDVSLAELEECIPAAQEQEPWEEQEVTKVLERFLRELDTGSRFMVRLIVLSCITTKCPSLVLFKSISTISTPISMQFCIPCNEFSGALRQSARCDTTSILSG